jgi:hypothetical protein
MAECRNCGGPDVRDLGSVGRVAPFFLKRVFGMEIRVTQPMSPLKRLIKGSLTRLAPLWRLYDRQVYVDMQICRRCQFVQAARPFRDDDLMRLYADYRSDTYNEERIHFEPTYAKWAGHVGYDAQEVQVRRNALAKFLQVSLPGTSFPTILDYGGSDGRFIPDLPGSKFVFEISHVEPVPGVTRIVQEKYLGKYSLVLLAHVIEHVSHPLDLIRSVSQYVEPGGFLYVETPQESQDAMLQQMQEGSASPPLGIHEHVNQYSLPAVRALLESAGLELVAMEKEEVNLGWLTGTHIRAIARKPASS